MISYQVSVDLQGTKVLKPKPQTIYVKMFFVRYKSLLLILHLSYGVTNNENVPRGFLMLNQNISRVLAFRYIIIRYIYQDYPHMNRILRKDD